MRTIKFRAWDGDKMLPDVPLLLSMDVLRTTTLNNAIADCQMQIMQFTGLLDKNGKEIYEGDLTKSERDVQDARFGGLQNIRQIFFESGSFWVGNLREDGSGCIFISLDSHRKDIEIIGNIYENPEYATV